jgi:hypothetical protein
MTVRYSTGLRDRLQGLRTNKVTNGSFTSATTGWTASSADLTSAGSGQSGNCLSVAESGSSNPGKAYQDVTVSEDKLLHFSFYFKKGTADGGRVFLGDGSTEDEYWDSGALTDADWTFYEAWIKPPVGGGSTVRITLQSTDATAGETSLFDTVVLETVEHGLKDIFKYGHAKIYSGVQPATADAAVSGTCLGEITNNHAVFAAWAAANGLLWGDPSSATIDKDLSQTWQFAGLANGTAGYIRFYGNEDDDGLANTSLPRIDMSIGTVGTDIIVSPTAAIVSGGIYTLDSCQIVFPYQAGASA